MSTASIPTAPHVAGPLDWVFGVALAAASVSVVGLPAVIADLDLPPSGGGAAMGAGVVGALALAACWITAALRRGRIRWGLPFLVVGVVLWLLQSLTSELLGWRLAVGVFGLLAAAVTTVGWFAMRRFDARAYAFLPLLLVGAVVAVFSPTITPLVAGLVLGSLLPVVGANIVQRPWR